VTRQEVEPLVTCTIIERHIAVITIDRVSRSNAITPAMMQRIGSFCDQCDLDPEVRVVILQGKGRWFCAGADMNDVDLMEGGGVQPPVDFRRDVYVPILRLNKPLIGSINGAAAGGGLGLALACDIRLASTGAIFAASFTRIGIVAHDLVTWFLPRVVGLPRAMELLYRSRPIDADEALRIGLVNRICEPEALEQTTLELAREIAALAPRALQATRRLTLEAECRSFEEHLMAQEYAALANRTVAPHDIVEGTSAFMERRKPDFRGPHRPR
jgi:enoyl-CoA hydratase/carnithine racemase